MQILFVNHISNGPAFNSAIAALSAFLKRHHPTIKNIVLNVRAENTVDRILMDIARISPDIIAFSIHTPHWENISGLMTAIRASSEALIVCGGYHPTLCPEEVIDHPAVDVVCIGEGETPLLELVRCLENKQSFDDIAGLWVKQRLMPVTKIVKNPLPVPEHLDALPYWDRDIFIESGVPVEQFSLTHIAGFPMATGRGCPYNCNFCNNSSLLKMYLGQGHKGSLYVRKRSVDNVIAECEFLMEKFNAQRFEFWDEMFATDPEWVKHFCERYIEKIHKPFICAIRVERADEKTLSRLRDAGCRCVFMGVEVGNENYRKQYLNRNMPNIVIEKAFEQASAVGLERFAWVMMGLPDENPELIDETIAFLLKIKPDIIGWSLFHPLPGTYLYQYCIEKGYLTEETVSPYQNAPEYQVPLLKQPSITKEEVMRFCDKFRNLEDFGFRVNK